MELKEKNNQDTPPTSTPKGSYANRNSGKKGGGFPPYISPKLRNIIVGASAAVFVACSAIGGVALAGSAQTDPGGTPPESTPYVMEIPTVGLALGMNLPPEPDPDDVPAIEPELPEGYVWGSRGGYSVHTNRDFIAWVRIGNSPLNYPVLQTTDNDYYLRRNFNKVSADAGAIFADWHVPIVDRNRPNNTVLYGHNMPNGTKFTYILKYNMATHNLASAYNQNPTIEFTTVFSEPNDPRNTYKIVGAMFVNTNGAEPDSFDYWRRRFFDTPDKFYSFVGEFMDRSQFHTNVDMRYGDEFLTLSTCYFPLGDRNDRMVLIARRTREGESPTVDIRQTRVNPSPKYFQRWYNAKGGSWAGRSWDTSLVEGFDEWLAAQG